MHCIGHARAPQLSNWVWLVNLQLWTGVTDWGLPSALQIWKENSYRWFSAGVSPALELKDCCRFAGGWCTLWKLSACPAPFYGYPHIFTVTVQDLLSFKKNCGRGYTSVLKGCIQAGLQLFCCCCCCCCLLFFLWQGSHGTLRASRVWASWLYSSGWHHRGSIPGESQAAIWERKSRSSVHYTDGSYTHCMQHEYILKQHYKDVNW